MLVLVLQWLSLHWEFVIMFKSQFPWTFCQIKNGCLFHCISYGYYCTDQDGLFDHLRDAPWGNIFKPGASAAVCEFCEWVQDKTDVMYKSLIINIRSIPTHPHLHAAAIPHTNNLLCVYQHIKSSESKVKFWQAGNSFKRVI